ncbi:ribosomal protein S18-alanine N-acetyltransferase [Candidatus Sororendozoicomonas aggregata]|uniref:ribosomal protein S18-alanine N-acetyltransferase n=1 Tax=Candidatus Sororendozoicomonas aggregata TaxID=3073239 RepID=UPI002ED334A3
MLTFRAMTEKDLPRVAVIEKAAGSHPWRTSHFIDSLKSRHCCQVAVMNNTIVGQGVMMLVADEAHLLILSVHGGFQGQGIGKAILRQLTEKAQQCEVRSFFLEVRESNTTARQLYANEGFNEIGRRRGYYPLSGGLSEDAIVMAMEIFP